MRVLAHSGGSLKGVPAKLLTVRKSKLIIVIF